jgi:hypothetical protein
MNLFSGNPDIVHALESNTHRRDAQPESVDNWKVDGQLGPGLVVSQTPRSSSMQDQMLEKS